MGYNTDGTNTTMLVEPAYRNGGGSNGMFGDNNGAWWIIILFLFIFCGWGGNRNGIGGNGGGAMEGYVLTSDFATIERKLDNVNSGLCDGFYAVAQQFSTLQNSMNQGFNGLNTTILTQSNATNMALMQGFNGVERLVCNLQAQIASCCCDIQRQVEGVNYNIATQSCETRTAVHEGVRDLMENNNANTRAILDKLSAQEMAAKDAQIAAQAQQIFTYQLRASQEAQNAYLIGQLRPCPTPAYLTCNPWAAQAPYGSCGGYYGFPVNNNCNCNNNNNCC